MEALSSSETWVLTRVIRHNIPEDGILHRQIMPYTPLTVCLRRGRTAQLLQHATSLVSAASVPDRCLLFSRLFGESSTTAQSCRSQWTGPTNPASPPNPPHTLEQVRKFGCSLHVKCLLLFVPFHAQTGICKTLAWQPPVLNEVKLPPLRGRGDR
jgi:hypothetical protein